jgi:acetyl esterase/lipase
MSSNDDSADSVSSGGAGFGCAAITVGAGVVGGFRVGRHAAGRNAGPWRAWHNNDDPAFGSTAREMAGAYIGGSPQEFPQRYTTISSATHVSADAPPTLIILGEADHLVPTGGTYRFIEQARAAGVDVKLVTVPYADHVFDARPGSIGQQAYRQLTAQWLRSHGQGP